MIENKRYYYTGKVLHPKENEGKSDWYFDDKHPIPCSPELIQQLGKDAREVVLGKDFELQYEVKEGSLAKWFWEPYTQELYERADPRFRRITAIPVKAVEGVEEKPEDAEAKRDKELKDIYQISERLRKQFILSDEQTIGIGGLLFYLASLEYRINQLEKQNNAANKF